MREHGRELRGVEHHDVSGQPDSGAQPPKLVESLPADSRAVWIRLTWPHAAKQRGRAAPIARASDTTRSRSANIVSARRVEALLPDDQELAAPSVCTRMIGRPAASVIFANGAFDRRSDGVSNCQRARAISRHPHQEKKSTRLALCSASVTATSFCIILRLEVHARQPTAPRDANFQRARIGLRRCDVRKLTCDCSFRRHPAHPTATESGSPPARQGIPSARPRMLAIDLRNLTKRFGSVDGRSRSLAAGGAR